MKRKPTIPTLLEYSCWKTHKRTRIVVAILLFISLTVTMAVLIVCFTAMKRKIRQCHLNFQQTPTNPVEYDDDPRAVAIGDFNNDQQIDVVVVNRAVDRISIYLASKNGTFEKPTIYPTGLHSQPNAVAVAHLRNNQQLDIVVACFGSHNIAIFLGIGDGSFINHRNISTRSSRPLFIHIAHLDNDPFVDLVTADYGTDSITVFAGDGTGSFEYAMSYPTGYDSLPVSVISDDLNGDQWIDLVVAHSGTNSIGIFFGRGTGTFFEQKILSTGSDSHPNSITVGYFNDDVLLDLAVANFGSNSTCVFLNTGNGTFAARQSYKLGEASPFFIGIGDVNKDKRLDLIITNKGGNNIGVLSGYGNGSFGAPTMYSTGSRSSITAVVRDLNDDSLLDIIVVHNDTKSVDIYFGKEESFQWEPRYLTIQNDADPQPFSQSDAASDEITTKAVDYSHQMRHRRQSGQNVCSDDHWIRQFSYGAKSLVIADLNNDTYFDVIVAYHSRGTIRIYFGRGNGSLQSQTINLVGSNPDCLLVMDWNNDGILDMIFAGGEDYSLGILVGLGNGTYTPGRIHSTTARLCPKIIVDLNGDGRSDIIATEISNSEPQIFVFLLNENGILPDPIVYFSEDVLQSLAVGDVDNDDQPDLIVLTNDAYIHVYLGSRNGNFAKPSKEREIEWAYEMMLGALDNDSYLDIVVSHTHDKNIGVLLGYGNGSFADPILYTTGYDVTSPRVADMNNDGLLDLITVDRDESKLVISFGDGHGSFARQIICSADFFPYFVAIGDLNGDTRLDIVVDNNREPTFSVFLLSPMQFSTDAIPLASNKGSRLSSIVAQDFNNDHILDLVVANYGTKTIGVLLGHGDGSFREQFTFPLDPSSNPFSITVGDFNSDKQLDLAVSNSGSTKIDLLLGDGTGMFTRQETFGYTLKQTPSMILADDLNNDGESELIVIYENSDDIDIYAAYDTGNFSAYTEHSTRIWPSLIAVGDFNNDTFPDVVAANYYSQNMSILFGVGNGSFSNEQIYSIGSPTSSIDVGDLNNDTFVDIVLVHTENRTISILLSQGNSSFLHSTIPLMTSLSEVRVHYVNDDAAPDIIAFNPYSSDVEIFLGYGNGSFVMGINQTIDPGLINEAAGDLNNDGHIDTVTISNLDNKLIIKLGFGNGTFVEQQRRQIPCYPIYARIGDLNKDKKLDIVVSSHKNRTISVLLGYGDGSFTAAAVYETGRFPAYSVLADLNNDNQMDIVVVNTASFSFSVLVGDSNLGFNYQKTLVTGNGSRARAFVTGDFNNDTHRDIAVINSGNHTLGIFLGYGNGSFSNQILYPTGASPSLIAVGDLNNDHYLDIVIVHSDDSMVSVHLGDGTGSFPHRTTFSMDVDSQPKSIVLADFDNDGLSDIIIANYAANNVIVLIGLGNGSFVSGKELRMGYGTHPFAVGVGDFNNDKKLDFALANYGRDNIEIHLQTC